MSGEYHRNHYVPIWYQQRFIPAEAKDRELLYLNLDPGTLTDTRGIVHSRKSLRRLGPKHCFFEPDLYATTLASIGPVDIERFFFGTIDSDGRHAVEHFGEFEHMKPGQHEAIKALMLYMSTQKLRTPKGLSWLRQKIPTDDRNLLLQRMIALRQLFCAIWHESIWLIADSSTSATKFIVSDHPVTVYNRRCGPRSQWCRGDNGHRDRQLVNAMHREMLVAVQVRRFTRLDELGRDADVSFRRGSNLFELTRRGGERERGGESGSKKEMSHPRRTLAGKSVARDTILRRFI